MDEMHFSATSVLGYSVECTKNAWYKKITLPEGHPEMSGKEQHVINAIEKPLLICKSGVPQDRHVYFSQPSIAKNNKLQYTKVIVSPPTEYNTIGTVITAHHTQKLGGNVEKGGVIYESGSETDV